MFVSNYHSCLLCRCWECVKIHNFFSQENKSLEAKVFQRNKKWVRLYLFKPEEHVCNCTFMGDYLSIFFQQHEINTPENEKTCVSFHCFNRNHTITCPLSEIPFPLSNSFTAIFHWGHKILQFKLSWISVTNTLYNKQKQAKH